jgi:putative transposase
LIKSGSVSSGRAVFLCWLTQVNPTHHILDDNGIGIDLGLKNHATISVGITIDNINKTKAIKKAEKKLRREQRKLSRKYDSLEKRKQTNK